MKVGDFSTPVLPIDKHVLNNIIDQMVLTDSYGKSHQILQNT